MRFYNYCLLFVLSIFMASCGYQASSGSSLISYESITIPYVKNDVDGLMTASLIRTIAQETGLQYEKCGGDLSLLVEIMEFENENVGFKYERKNDNTLRHSVIPSETRLTVVAKVQILSTASQESLIGPVFMTAYVDFDHEYEKTRNGVNIFSLGQLTDFDEANDAAHFPVYRALSKKIADLIITI